MATDGSMLPVINKINCPAFAEAATRREVWRHRHSSLEIVRVTLVPTMKELEDIE